MYAAVYIFVRFTHLLGWVLQAHYSCAVLWNKSFGDFEDIAVKTVKTGCNISCNLNVLLLVCTIVFTLDGCYCQERDDRLNWLLHLRERLLLKNLEDANQELHDASRSDMLTEVANRRHFDEHLAEVWARHQRDGGEVALIMIDVDHFKAYNDRYGHPMGDACLKAVAGALKRRLRGPGDLIARYGGEEFIAVLSGASLQTVHGAAERIRRGIEGLNLLHATSSTHAVVTVSIGVATHTDKAESLARLIALADNALYQAKAEGRNRVIAGVA